jgi:hypothetical protein
LKEEVEAVAVALFIAHQQDANDMAVCYTTTKTHKLSNFGSWRSTSDWQRMAKKSKKEGAM